MMQRTLTSLSGAALLLAAMSCVHAQAKEAAPQAQPAPADQPLEPAVDTSQAKDPAESQAAPAGEAPQADRKDSESGNNAPPPAPSASSENPQAADPAAKQDRSGRFKTMDRLELDSSAVTGNRELPKVLYIVPWKKADLGDLVGRPASSLLDEVLSPVDRDVFRRQTEYFSTLEQGAAGSEQPPAQTQTQPSPPPAK